MDRLTLATCFWHFRVAMPVWSAVRNLAYLYANKHRLATARFQKAAIERQMRYDYANPIWAATNPLGYAVASAFLNFAYREDRGGDWRQWVVTSLISGGGDCEDFATLGKWALETLGFKARIVWLLRTDGKGSHAIAMTNDGHWVVRGTRTVDLWEYAENNRETDMREALLGFFGAEYYAVYGTGWK